MYREMAESMARGMAAPAPMLEPYGERPALVPERERVIPIPPARVVGGFEGLVFLDDGRVYRRSARDGKLRWLPETPVPGTEAACTAS